MIQKNTKMKADKSLKKISPSRDNQLSLISDGHHSCKHMDKIA